MAFSSSASSAQTKRNGKAATSPTAPPQTPVLFPVPDNRDGWRAHWKAQGQLWRTEPEIDAQRQEELAKRRAIVPDIKKGIYPFSGMKLNRADIEWLLATHENGRGPIDWSNESRREREGLDLRGADLSGSEDQRVNLTSLPLARLVGGLDFHDRISASEEQRKLASVMLTRADLSGAQLEGAHLCYAQLEGVHLEGAQLKEADLGRAQLMEAVLFGAQLKGVVLHGAQLERANLCYAQLEGADLKDVKLANNDHVGPSLADVQWGNVNLAVIDWSEVALLGDEPEVRQKRKRNGDWKRKADPFYKSKAAVRANRQLSVVLQGQGLNEEAERFAYRAQDLQKAVYGFQMVQDDPSLRQRARALGSWLFSGFLSLLAGYGYKPLRSFLAYLLVIASFATTYYFLGHAVGPTLSPLGAFVFSMTSFHGRGFFPGNNISLDDPLTVLAAFEALVGLIIEVTFIATLTQRLFNR